MMQRLTERRDYNCACWNGNQDFTTHKRYLEMLEALCAYEDLNRTPEQLASDLADLAAYRKAEKEGKLVRVVHGKWEKDCDTIKCSNCGFGMFKTGYFFMNGECFSANDGKFIPSSCPNCGANMGGNSHEEH